MATYDNPLLGQTYAATPYDAIDARLDSLSSLGGIVVAAYNTPERIRNSASVFCDGTNDQIEINAAIVGGGKVVLLDGTYNISSAIILPSNSSLVGQGSSTEVVRDATPVNGACNGVLVVGTSILDITNVKISNVRLTGPSTSVAMVNGDGVQIKYANNVTVEGCYISGFGALGDDGSVASTYSDYITVRWGHHYNNLNGPIFGMATGSTEIPNCSDCVVDSVRLYQNWADGTHGQNCDRIRWTNNKAYSNGESGIDLLGCMDCEVLGNLSMDNGHEGIEIGQSVIGGRPDEGHVVSSNTCIGNHTLATSGGGGILVSGLSKRILVTGNSCVRNFNSGIHLGNTGGSYLIEDVTVSNNLSYGNEEVGIHISGAANQNIVKGNSIYDNGTRGIDMTTSGTTPLSTVIRNNNLENNPTQIFRSGGIDATTIIRDNEGYVTENKGSATVLDTTSAITVNHGLAVTPVSVSLTPRTSGTVWVSARTATTFTITRTGTSGALVVDWIAQA